MKDFNYVRWVGLKEKIKGLTEELHGVEADLWLQAESMGMLNPNGSKTFEDAGYKITITHGETVKVDAQKAAVNPELFRIKYEFSKTDYKLLTDSQRSVVDEAITITPSKPNFKVIRMEE